MGRLSEVIGTVKEEAIDVEYDPNNHCCRGR